MSAWVVIPSLLKLREEFNLVAPKRDKGADGTIGDSNHLSTSDHTPDEDSSYLANKDSDRKNEVHALDIDSDGPWPDGSGRELGGWFDRKIRAIIAEEKRRWLDPNDVCRLEYVIHRRKIYSRSRNFEPVDYTGDDPHIDHAHCSARYLTVAENDTRPWGVYEEDELSAQDVKDILAGISALKTSINTVNVNLTKQINEVASEVWAIKLGSKAVPGRTTLAALRDLEDVRALGRFPATHAEAKAAGYPADSPLVELFGVADRLAALETAVKALKST